MYKRTPRSKFLTNLLHNPTYRKAHHIDTLILDIQRALSNDWNNLVAVVLLHYVEGTGGKMHLAVNVLVKSDVRDPGSCIQGELTQGVNFALEMCGDLGLVFAKAVPASYTTELSGLHITRNGPHYYED
jgi:hypothetical protein